MRRVRNQDVEWMTQNLEDELIGGAVGELKLEKSSSVNAPQLPEITPLLGA